MGAKFGKPQGTPGELLGEDALVQYRMGHLNMLQGVIGRMAGYSSSVKNFTVTIAAASLALAFDKSTGMPLWIAVGAILLLGALDTYYLAMEKGFRATYERVADAPLSEATDLRIAPDSVKLVSAARSVSVWPFYLVQLAVAGWLLWQGVGK